MKKFVQRNRILMVIVSIIMIVSLFFVSYLPSNTALKKLTLENFNYVADAKFSSIEIEIERNIESAKSMSSRTAIRNKIVEYQNGTVTFNELHDFSYDKYLDGFNVIEDALQAVRIVDNMVLLNVGEDKLNTDELIPNVDGLSDLTYEITDATLHEMIVYSPIISGDDIVGYDVLLYSLDKYVTAIQQDGYKIDFRELDDISPEITSTNYTNIYKLRDTFQYIQAVSDQHALIIETNSSYLYRDVYSISNQNIISSLILGIILIGFVNFYVMKFARQIINLLSNQKEEYHNKMMIDPLTKTFSRNYLENMLVDKSIVLNTTSVIMIDVDHFKDINDTHGHLIGDDVLAFIGNVLLSSFRDTDSIIRFGGDEFLVILSGTSYKYAEMTMQRVEKKLQNENSFHFEISVSYGISSISELEKLETAIEEADSIMYSKK